jgi:serine/threonine protein kinase
MPLATGSQLGPYEIISPLGAGGMGEVYKALDTRLGRTIAIKICAEQFSDRFQLEARAVAALNHPHVCTLHDVGPNYLVMEYIEGKPLKGPLPLDRALELAIQITGALDAAHRKGIVHRDLKPGNIMVAKSGVKLLDFGLARITTPKPASDESLTRTLTMEGAIVGTLQYMAPEQLQGKEADARSDIFAFGSVLYEMVTGQKAFPGADPASIIGAIMHKDPRPVSELQPVTPPSLDRVIRKCLAKDPDQRWQTAADLHDELQWIAAGGGGAAAVRRRRPWLPWGIAAALALIAAGAILRPGDPATPALTAWKLSVLPPPGVELPQVGSGSSTPEVSPDGSAIIFTGMTPMLYLRRLAAQEAIPLRGTESATQPFWSPNSKSIGFFTLTHMMKMRLPDGALEAVAPLSGYYRGASWGAGETILISTLTGQGLRLHTVPASGGRVALLEMPGLSGGNFFFPTFLPNGEDFVFYWGREEKPDEASAYLATLRNGRVIRGPIFLRRNVTTAKYTPYAGGRLMFVQNDNLYAQELDVKAGKLAGQPELTTLSVASYPKGHLANFSVSQSGVLAWRPGTAALERITWFDRQGHELTAAGTPGNFQSLALSPDEKRVCADVEDGIWIVEPGRSGNFIVPGLHNPLWSPDGLSLLAQRMHPGTRADVVELPVARAGDVHELTRIPGNQADIRFDRKLLLYTEDFSAYSIQLDGGKPQSLVLSRPGERIVSPSFSPDGRWLLYTVYSQAKSELKSEIYARPLTAAGLPKQISASGGHPVWRKDGKEILYLDGSKIQSVRVEQAGGELRVSPPEPLFTVRVPVMNLSQKPLQVSRDGSRIVFTQAAEQPSPQVIHVAAGWDTGIRK